MNEWQPIETAPKDGTAVLVTGGTYGCDDISCEFHHLPFKEVAVARWDKVDRMWWFCFGGAFYANPTCWMPLPDPPIAKGAKE